MYIHVCKAIVIEEEEAAAINLRMVGMGGVEGGIREELEGENEGVNAAILFHLSL